MEDDIHAGDRATTHVRVAEIPEHKLDTIGQVGEIGFVARAEIVHHPNGVSESDESFGEVRADEAGTPCHQALRRRCEHATLLGQLDVVPAARADQDRRNRFGALQLQSRRRASSHVRHE